MDYYPSTGGDGTVIELRKLNGDLQKLHSPGFGSKRNRLVTPCPSTIASASSRLSSPRLGMMFRTFSTTCVRWRGRAGSMLSCILLRYGYAVPSSMYRTSDRR